MSSRKLTYKDVIGFDLKLYFMNGSELLTLVILLSPGMLLSVLIMLTFSKGG
jgi:hypothetical protein